MVTMSIGEIKFDAPLTDIDGKTGVGLSISHRFEPTKDGGRVTYWGAEHPQTAEAQKALAKSYLDGRISVRDYRKATAEILRRNNVGPADAAYREDFYKEIEKRLPAPQPDLISQQK